jgi:hypothetical protein
MRIKKDIIYITGLFSAVITVFVFIYQIILSNELINYQLGRILQPIFLIFLGSTVTAFIIYLMRTINRNPAPLQMSILGLPESGKTVYLSVLFNELQQYKDSDLLVQPYGIETIEYVNKNIKKLKSGEWLERTATNSIFYFRASALLGSNLFAKKYTLEIGDYAGEKINELNSQSEMWLHKTDYFKDVVRSQIIFLVIDAAVIFEKNINMAKNVEQILISAFQVLLESKGVKLDKRLNDPIALMVTKSDLLDENLHNLIYDEFRTLINICTKRCSSFSIFFVSSVGELSDNSLPPSRLHPQNVVEPLKWCLSRVDVK